MEPPRNVTDAIFPSGGSQVLSDGKHLCRRLSTTDVAPNVEGILSHKGEVPVTARASLDMLARFRCLAV